MLELDSRRYWFKSKRVWFSDRPFDITGYHYVAFFDTTSKVDLAGFQRTSTHNVVIDLTQDLDTIWKKMSKKSTREGIKSAQRAGVRVKLNDHYDEFQDLTDSFQKTKGLSPDFVPTSVLKRGGPLFADVLGEDQEGSLLWKKWTRLYAMILRYSSEKA